MCENLLYKIEIFLLIEAKYGIHIGDDEVEYIVTFEDLINLVREKHEKTQDLNDTPTYVTRHILSRKT